MQVTCRPDGRRVGFIGPMGWKWVDKQGMDSDNKIPGPKGISESREALI